MEKQNNKTLASIYRKSKNFLRSSRENGSMANNFDIIQLMKYCFNISREDIILKSNQEVEEESLDHFLNLLKLRAKGYPLQYILKSWEICGLNFKVGPGVLIPREDTVALVHVVEKFIELKFEHQERINILDLCAGSGLISIFLAKKFPLAKITAVEWFDKPIEYLNKNISLNKISNVYVIKADVLKQPPPCMQGCKFDIIVSNPPYIPSKELIGLQKEVRYEPREALDGGKDGLLFYRSILKNWLVLLKTCSPALMAFEIGDKNQAKSVINMFKNFNLSKVNVHNDINGLNRVVCASI